VVLQLLDMLNAPRPVSLEAAPSITAESFSTLLTMKRQCEMMVGQLNAIRAKRPNMCKAPHPLQQQQQHQHLQQPPQQQQVVAAAMNAGGGYGHAVATPDEVGGVCVVICMFVCLQGWHVARDIPACWWMVDG
jgi:hypothetical protein